MKTPRPTERALGIIATGRRVDAVLLEAGPEGPVVSRLLSRSRMHGRPEVSAGAAVGVGPELAEELSSDVTLSFGDGEGSGSELFLSSEFGGLGAQGASPEAVKPADTFELELADVLEEIGSLSDPDVAVAFSLDAGDTEHVSLVVPEARSTADRDKLLKALAAAYPGDYDEERVAFVSMSPAEDGARRYLAVFPASNDPVRATLQKLVDQGERLPTRGLLDAEATTYLSLVRLERQAAFARRDAEPAEPAGDGAAPTEGTPDDPPAAANTLVVRAGLEDTLLISLHEETLQYCETLQSLTAFDVPDTLCSRVLLQQDEHGVGTPQRILVLSEEREEELIKTFRRFFPQASVTSLRSLLPVAGVPDGGSATLVAAATAALRLMPAFDGRNAFVPVDFMPRKLLKRRIRIPVNVPALVLGLFVVVTVVFFFASYSQAADEIAAREQRLHGLTGVELSGDVDMLQAQIDSMRQQHARYLRALDILDSLLAGSDRWSRTIEKVSTNTAAVEGIWVESMTPQAGGVRLMGNATARDRVVSFARYVDGTIESLTFSEIREWPVFSFSILVPIDQGLPETARYLREQVAISLRDSTGAGPAPGPASPPARTEDDAPIRDSLSAPADGAVASR